MSFLAVQRDHPISTHGESLKGILTQYVLFGNVMKSDNPFHFGL